jgi:DNA-binding transcriptional LysR family regulator
VRIEQLEYVAAVTRLGSMRRASEELHITQPALSETIRNLERELGVVLLDRHRAGARVSPAGREVMPWIIEVLDAVHRLRAAADEQAHAKQVLRIGTVYAATAPLVAPAIRTFRGRYPGTQVELVNVMHNDVAVALKGGTLDLGLVNLMDNTDHDPELETVEITRGRAVVCCRADSRLAAVDEVSVEALFAEPFIAMRSGYLMHRYAHRLLAGRPADFAYSADGAEMGKLMVAEGLGVTLLPDYSIIGDPLERRGVITYRRLAATGSEVILVAQHLRARHLPTPVRQMEAILRRAAIRLRAPASAS